MDASDALFTNSWVRIVAGEIMRDRFHEPLLSLNQNLLVVGEVYWFHWRWFFLVYLIISLIGRFSFPWQKDNQIDLKYDSLFLRHSVYSFMQISHCSIGCRFFKFFSHCYFFSFSQQY